jgi:glycosyltransferase involved in cell wall biosynthesis
MQKPLISVLVPIYKVELHLEKCIDSIFSQSYSNIEYIFVDDCSPDNSVKILLQSIQQHKIENSRITIIHHKENLGIAVTRNDCVKAAHGEYVLFVDSDDWVNTNIIEKMVMATHHGTIDIVGCDYAKEFNNSTRTLHRENYSATCRENMLKCINYEISTVLWKFLIRRRLFDHFDFIPHLNIGEDYIAAIKLFYYAKSFYAIHEPLYHYVQYNSNRYSFQIEKSVNDHIRAVKEVERFLKEESAYDLEVDRRLRIRKFQIKSYFLNRELYDYKRWKETFPEANHMYKAMGYNRKERLKFWLAAHHLLHFISLFK